MFSKFFFPKRDTDEVETDDVDALPKWVPRMPQWTQAEEALLPKELTKPSYTTLEILLEKSEQFPREFPLDTNRCKSLKGLLGSAVLERNINSTYPVMHENVLHLCAKFILYKRQHGSNIEKNIYQNMDLVQCVDRLLTKRAVSFVGPSDLYRLVDKSEGHGWEGVGTANEKDPLVLKNCLSYDEMKLSAFLSASCFTHFMNEGERRNLGVFESDRNLVQDEGVIVGVIGPRLHKPGVMEWQEILVTEDQNCQINGYGNSRPKSLHHLFSELYDEECLTYSEVVKFRKNQSKTARRYLDVKQGFIFDNFMYSKRLTLSLDTFFMEANYRAQECQTYAYVHVVGIGLGVWKVSPHQNKFFMDTCGYRIQTLGLSLCSISDICFSYIQHDSCLEFKDGDLVPIAGHPLDGIKIHIGKRQPFSKLTGEDQAKLLVVSFAWDSNALPGNEYWGGYLANSSDSATASSTQIAELLNSFVNPNLCASNLKVVTCNRVVDLEEYTKMITKQE